MRCSIASYNNDACFFLFLFFVLSDTTLSFWPGIAAILKKSRLLFYN